MLLKGNDVEDRLYIETNNEITFSAVVFPEYDCPKCGKVTDTITVRIDGLDGVFCQKCYVKNVIIPNCERLKPQTEKESE